MAQGLPITPVPETMQMTQQESDTVKKIKAEAKHLFEAARGSHDWEHTIRVCRLCAHIGPIEGADMDVLMAAAYLHDIGRCHQDASDGRICHAAKGAEMARPIL